MAMGLGKRNMTLSGDPPSLPDIHALFCHYNKIYFDDLLGSCFVSWSSPPMISCTANCYYGPGGGCEIDLSEPLLKFRSTSDIKNALLHEMIHAFLWIKNKNKDHSNHGPSFQDMMNAINFSSVVDHQRPHGGYNITVYHEFHEDNSHKKVCFSSYATKAKSPGFSDKKMKAKDDQELHDDKPKVLRYMTRQTMKRLCKTGVKEKSNGGNAITIANYSPAVDAKRKSGNRSSFSDDFEEEPSCEDFKAKGKKHAYSFKKRIRGEKFKKEYTFASGFLGVYGDEESEEDVEPLINKRTERRKKQKMANL